MGGAISLRISHEFVSDEKNNSAKYGRHVLTATPSNSLSDSRNQPSRTNDVCDAKNKATNKGRLKKSLSQFPEFLTSLEDEELSVVACYKSGLLEYVSNSVTKHLGSDIIDVDYPVAPRQRAIYYRRHRVTGSLVRFHNTMLARLPSGMVFTIDHPMTNVTAQESLLTMLVTRSGEVIVCEGGCTPICGGVGGIVGKNLFQLSHSEAANKVSDALCAGVIEEHSCSRSSSVLTTFAFSDKQHRCVLMDFFPCAGVEHVVVTVSSLEGGDSDVDVTGEEGSSSLNQHDYQPLNMEREYLWQRRLSKLSAEIDYLQDFRDKCLLPMYSVSPEGVILWANDAMVEMMGYSSSRHQYIGTITTKYHVDQMLVAQMFKTVFEGECLVDFPCNVIRKDGHILNVTYNSNAKFDESGAYLYSRCIVQDMTERNKLRNDISELEKKQLSAEQKEKAAITASRTKSDFLAVMSHEIRTPINGVIGATSLLAVTNLNDEQRDYVNTISDSADILLSLVHNILDISKIEKGKFELDKVSLRLADLVRKCGDMMKNRALEKGIALITTIGMELDDQDVWHHGDPTRLNQVLLNFLSNAVKFTHSGSVECRLTVLPPPDMVNSSTTCLLPDDNDAMDSRRVSAQNSIRDLDCVDDKNSDQSVRHSSMRDVSPKARTMFLHLGALPSAGSTSSFFVSSASKTPTGTNYDVIRIEVVDTGCGIADCSNLFSAFVQATPSVHQKYGGTGLGLNISKKIVQMMHGRVGIHSVEGQGTTVWAEIPLRRAPVPRKAPGFNTTSLLRRSDSSGGGSPSKKLHHHVLRSSTSGVGDNRAKRSSRTSNGDVKSVRILIAEDNKVNQKVLKRTLETLGYTDITVAWNGQEAVAAMKDSWDIFLSTPSVGRFDLVLMDCLMPVMDGWSATEAIRAMEVSTLASAAALSLQNPAYLDVQPTIVLALTANATEEDRIRCSVCGMDGFYVKPMSRDGINAMMLYWVSKLFADDMSVRSNNSNNSLRFADGDDQPNWRGGSGRMLEISERATFDEGDFGA